MEANPTRKHDTIVVQLDVIPSKKLKLYHKKATLVTSTAYSRIQTKIGGGDAGLAKRRALMYPQSNLDQGELHQAKKRDKRAARLVNWAGATFALRQSRVQMKSVAFITQPSLRYGRAPRLEL